MLTSSAATPAPAAAIATSASATSARRRPCVCSARPGSGSAIAPPFFSLARPPRPAEPDGIAVAHRRMAVYAGELALRSSARADEVVHELAVAREAARLEDRGVPRRDPDRLGEVLERERLGVVPAVARLGEILADEVVREVSVDAGRDAVVARLLPGLVVRLHDVAVRAGRRVRAQVGSALGVAQRREAEARDQRRGRRDEQERAPRARCARRNTALPPPRHGARRYQPAPA